MERAELNPCARFLIPTEFNINLHNPPKTGEAKRKERKNPFAVDTE